MRNLVMISALLTTLAHSSEETCLNKHLSGKEIKSVTGVGLTIEDAQIDLHGKLPQLGVLETVKLSTVKTSTPNTYSERSTLSKSVKASFEYFSVRNCRLPDGRHASSVAIPKEGISYLPKDKSAEVFSEPIFKKEYATLAYAKKVCGSDIYTVVVSLNDFHEIQGGRLASRSTVKGVDVSIVCGQFSFMSKWYNHGWTTRKQEVFANKYNLIYLGSYRTYEVADYSDELGLEMIKNAMWVNE